MISRLRNALRPAKPPRSLRFDRPLVLLQSDDWGRVGVRDREGWDELRAAGLNLGEKPYDFYSLETADDLGALAELLARHRDATGRKPAMVMNFIMANVDLERRVESGPKVPLRPLTEGLPAVWRRPRLFEAYAEGIRERIFYPALHGLTHFCEQAVARETESGGERWELLHKLWRAGCPYIYWRMPWIGYEYWKPEEKPGRRFLSLDEQRDRIVQAAEVFRQMFGSTPFSACAPGYRANEDTRTAWFESGVRVAQNGPGEHKAAELDERGMLSVYRTLEMEPAVEACDVETLLQKAGECFIAGVPAVISIHAINFHSTIRDFRTPTLKLLDEFLTALETRWPKLLYINDADLFTIATAGGYAGESGRVAVGASVAMPRR